MCIAHFRIFPFLVSALRPEFWNVNCTSRSVLIRWKNQEHGWTAFFLLISKLKKVFRKNHFPQKNLRRKYSRASFDDFWTLVIVKSTKYGSRLEHILKCELHISEKYWSFLKTKGTNGKRFSQGFENCKSFFLKNIFPIFNSRASPIRPLTT